MQYLAIMLLFFCVQASAFQVKTIVNDEITQATISAHELSRIYVKGDRIAYVRGVEGAYTFKADQDSGAIYIKPNSSYQAKPFTLHVTTEQHSNYRLLLTPSDIPAESIVLVGMDEGKGPSVNVRSSVSVNALLSLIAHMSKEEIMPDYVIQASDNKVLVANQPNGLGKVLKKTYKGETLTGNIYELTNRGQGPIALQETMFYQLNTKAIALSTVVLAPGQQAKLYEVIGTGHEI